MSGSEKSALSCLQDLPSSPGDILFIGVCSFFSCSFSLFSGFAFLLFIFSSLVMEKLPIDIIYEYTKLLLSEYGESLTRIDTKISIFIGFSGVLIRLAYDLPDEHLHFRILKLLICFFALLTIITSALGLIAKPSGNVADPKVLMSDEWFFERSEEFHKAYIVNGFINTLDEFEILFSKRRVTLAWVITFFVISVILFGVTVAIS